MRDIEFDKTACEWAYLYFYLRFGSGEPVLNHRRGSRHSDPNLLTDSKNIGSYLYRALPKYF